MSHCGSCRGHVRKKGACLRSVRSKIHEPKKRSHRHTDPKLNPSEYTRTQFPAFGAQSSTQTRAREIRAAPAHMVKRKETQQTTRSHKHQMTLHVIPLNQQRFMGLSRLVAAGPPDPEHAPKTHEQSSARDRSAVQARVTLRSYLCVTLAFRRKALHSPVARSPGLCSDLNAAPALGSLDRLSSGQTPGV